MRQTFPLRRDWVWRGPLMLIGATQQRAYVALLDEMLVLRFGFLHARLPYEAIADVRQRSWSVLNGIGLRVSLDGALGLIGSLRGVVELRLTTKRSFKALVRISVAKVALSLEEPERFVDALRERIQG